MSNEFGQWPPYRPRLPRRSRKPCQPYRRTTQCLRYRKLRECTSKCPKEWLRYRRQSTFSSHKGQSSRRSIRTILQRKIYRTTNYLRRRSWSTNEINRRRCPRRSEPRNSTSYPSACQHVSFAPCKYPLSRNFLHEYDRGLKRQNSNK